MKSGVTGVGRSLAESGPHGWTKDGDALFDRYRHTLEGMGRQPGTLALIFGKATMPPPDFGAVA